MNALANPARLNYIDNLRAFAFSMMLLFHTLKLFSPEGWGIHLTPLPGAHLAAEIITSWRLPLLFFISGAAFSISIKQKNILNRTARKLLPVLIIGTPVLVSVANYLHDRYINPVAGLLSHFSTYFQNTLRGVLSWYHLWYLGYILFFVAIHQATYDLIKKLGISISQKQLLWVLSITVLVTFVNEWLLRPFFPVRRNFYSDIASLVSFACYYMAGMTLIKLPASLKLNAALAWPLSAVALMAVFIHFSVSLLPLAITKTIIAWSAIFALNRLFYRYLNIKLALTKALHNKLLDIYVIHQLTLLAATFITIYLPDGLLKICVIFTIGYALAYLAGSTKYYIKYLIKKMIKSKTHLTDAQ